MKGRLFHTLILRRMCNYKAAGARRGFSHDPKKNVLMNTSMRSIRQGMRVERKAGGSYCQGVRVRCDAFPPCKTMTSQQCDCSLGMVNLDQH